MTNKDLKQRLAEDMLDNLRGTMKTEDMLKVVIHHEKTVLREKSKSFEEGRKAGIIESTEGS